MKGLVSGLVRFGQERCVDASAQGGLKVEQIRQQGVRTGATPAVNEVKKRKREPSETPLGADRATRGRYMKHAYASVSLHAIRPEATRSSCFTALHLRSKSEKAKARMYRLTIFQVSALIFSVSLVKLKIFYYSTAVLGRR